MVRAFSFPTQSKHISLSGFELDFVPRCRLSEGLQGGLRGAVASISWLNGAKRDRPGGRPLRVFHTDARIRVLTPPWWTCLEDVRTWVYENFANFKLPELVDLEGRDTVP
jgi:hypothetical protein